MSIAVVPSFIEDRAIFTRERANGYYHVCQILAADVCRFALLFGRLVVGVSYQVAAHVLADSVVTAPGLFVIALICTVTLYWIIGLSHGGEGFIIFVLALFISLFALR